MGTRPMTAEVMQRAAEAVEKHGTVAAAALALGMSRSTVQGQYMKWLQSRQQPIEPPETVAEVAPMRESSLESQFEAMKKELAAFKAERAPKRVPMECDAELPTDPAEAWAAAEIDSAKRIAFAKERSRFRVSFDEGPIAVAFTSDQHISPGNTVDFARMRADAELIRDTPGLYCCLGGDGVDNHILIRSAMMAARSQPHDQYRLYNYYLGILAEKVMAVISGNHDAWTDQVAGIDMVSSLADANKLCYSPAEARIECTVGGYPYKLAMRHQYRFNSSFNMLHAVKQWYRMGDEPFDIGVICHHHEPEVGTFESHGMTRWAARPGAYQISSSYTRQYGWNSTYPTNPTFVLFPGVREVVPFQDMRRAADYLTKLRG